MRSSLRAAAPDVSIGGTRSRRTFLSARGSANFYYFREGAPFPGTGRASGGALPVAPSLPACAWSA